MLHIHPITCDYLARSIQSDYQQAAKHRRLLQESGYEPAHTASVIKFGFALSATILIIVAISQFVTL